jgi:hypothetical protein
LQFCPAKHILSAHTPLKKNKNRSGSVVQVMEYLPGEQEALNSNLNITKKKKNKTMDWLLPPIP